MSIKEPRKRASSDLQDDQHSGRRLVPETTIRDFIGGLGIRNVCDAASRFQMVADVTSNPSQHRVTQLDASAMRLLKQIARASSNKQHRVIMKAIIAAVAQGPEGINGAYLTATHVVGSAFRWTGEYHSALQDFKDKLRRMRQRADANIKRTKAPLKNSEKTASAIS